MLRRAFSLGVNNSRHIIRRQFCATGLQVRELPQAGEGAIPDFLNLTVSTPGRTLCEDTPARLVTVPGGAGVFGVLPGHIPVLCELQPGILSVYYEMSQSGGRQDHYFVSGGFCVVHPNSTMEIAAVDAHPLDEIDTVQVTANLTAAQQKLAAVAKGGEEEIAAQIQVSVLERMANVIAFAPK